MWVKCDYSDCEHNRDQECQLKYISLVDGSCTDYKDYVTNNPLYKNPYFKRIKTLIDGNRIECRTRSYGMRYEWRGIVLYTEDDIRYSIDNAGFTEEVTGCYVSGFDLQTREGYEENIRKCIENLSPVLSLPWMEIDKKSKKLEPYKEESA